MATRFKACEWRKAQALNVVGKLLLVAANGVTRRKLQTPGIAEEHKDRKHLQSTRQRCSLRMSIKRIVASLAAFTSIAPVLHVSAPPLCAGALWPMPAWVWRDVRSVFLYFIFYMYIIYTHTYIYIYIYIYLHIYILLKPARQYYMLHRGLKGVRIHERFCVTHGESNKGQESRRHNQNHHQTNQATPKQPMNNTTNLCTKHPTHHTHQPALHPH